MEAKEMFEALGYVCIYSDDYNLTYVKIFKENNVKYEIDFLLAEKEVTITPTYYDEQIYFVQLDKETIQVINQQCKELGWLDEE